MTQLTYAITPETVPVSSSQNLKLVITNPSEKFPVALNPGPTTLISVQNLSQLTASPGDIHATPPAGTAWQAGLVDGSTGKYLKIWITAPVSLAPQQSVAIQLDDIKVVDSPGTATLNVVEFINGAKATPPALQIGLLAASLQIFALAKPVTVGLGQQTMLQWTIVQGVYVTVVPPDDGAQYFRNGQGWYTHAIPVQPSQDERQTIYTLTVYQDQSNFETAMVVVNLSPPQIASFHTEADGNGLLTIDQPVDISWVVHYAPQVTLRPSKSAGYVAPEDQRRITPGNFLAPNASSVAFTLTADGFKGPVRKTLTFQFAPMRIQCFRYPDFDTRDAYVIDVFNGRPTIQQGTTAGAFTLDAVGPGGPLTQQLGGTGLEVQVLVGDPPQIARGAFTTLRYRVQNATSLTLLPDNIPLGVDGRGLGSVVVAPSQTTVYTLRATNATNQLESDITIVVIG